VRGQLRGILPDHGLPRRLATLPKLPLRGPGKPDRAAVRRLFDQSC
jgi:O-succinylbenzoic acid--CoA ligase